MFQVTIPQGVQPGQFLQVKAPSGKDMQVQIPPGVQPGQIIQVQDPSATGAGDPSSVGMMNAAYIPSGPDDMDFEKYVPLEEVRFDITNYIEMLCQFVMCPCTGCKKTTLMLNDQEAVLREKDLCRTNTQRRPYAQLQSVDKLHSLCCVSFSSGFHTLDPEQAAQGQGGISPGLGCDEALVDKIVNELQSRKEKRGNIAQMRKLEFMLEKVLQTATYFPLIMNRMGLKHEVKVPPTPQQKKQFQQKKFDVSHYCEMLLGCTFTEIELGPEEVLMTKNKCFGCQSYTQKREYAQLGTVEMGKQCIVCRNLDSDLGPPISPGCGCDKTKVMTLVSELRDRMGERGEIGQIRKQERIFHQMVELDQELPKIMEKQGIAYPPDQATMARICPGETPDIPMLKKQGVAAQIATTSQVEPKTIDVTNKCDACSTCLCTCGVAGCTKRQMQLNEDMIIITEKNNLDDLNIHMPYAQMGSVDFNKSCCCCYSVNDESPGWGCDAGRVQDLAEELQKRKVMRGNIAQVKQLEAMQSSIVDLNVQGSLICEKESVQYPPGQQAIDASFNGKRPRILDEPIPHLEAAKPFETKEYNVTNYQECCCQLLCCPCCGPVTRQMTLGPEEMLMVRTDFCSKSNERTPYAQLGAVEVETTCLCCSELPDVATPACGCANALVEEIANELQARKVQRGNIAQFKMQENLINEMLKLTVKAKLLADKKGVGAWPPSQELMASVFPNLGSPS